MFTFSKIKILNNYIGNNKASWAGGGIYLEYSSPQISNNTIINNNVSYDGGGIYMESSSPQISNNTISHNNANSQAGGIFLWDSNPDINNNTISNNNTTYYGGGIYVWDSNPNVNKNTINNNFAEYGGGMCVYMSSPQIINNIIINNSAGNGGGIYLMHSNSKIINNIISNNFCNGYYGGSGIYRSCDNPVIRNTILWGNKRDTIDEQIISTGEGVLTVKYSCIQGGWSGEGNINDDPSFISPSGGSGKDYDGLLANWRLKSSSPCIDTGDPDPTGLPSTDRDGNLRIWNGRVDMGAYEYLGLKLKLKVFLQGAYRY
ncbi:MAG: right-handed parallel beta-helix repeat-containing protein [Ignavibacteriales bacterium]|nr:right-handed parallel beta-helix repeat-containing protein [Ignavibacteriales bacterium]